jgi:hypothetical protein
MTSSAYLAQIYRDNDLALKRFRTSVASRDVARSRQTKRSFIKITVSCTDNTIDAFSCANCGLGEHRIVRLGWKFRNSTLFGKKIGVEIASTGVGRYNEPFLIFNKTTELCTLSKIWDVTELEPRSSYRISNGLVACIWHNVRLCVMDFFILCR